VLNILSEINNEAIGRLQQIQVNHTMDLPPTQQEVQKAIEKLALGKAPGSENIPAEIYREGGKVLLSKFGCLDGFITMVP
jgi:hypothetical protein